MEAKDGKHTPLSQHVGDSTSDSTVQHLSVFLRILPSLSFVAQHNAVQRAGGVVHGYVLEGGSGRVGLVNPFILQNTAVQVNCARRYDRKRVCVN